METKNVRSHLLVIVVAVIMSGCVTDQPDAGDEGPEPTAKSGSQAVPAVWEPWLLSSRDELRPGPPPTEGTPEHEADAAGLPETPRLPVDGSAFSDTSATFHWTELQLETATKHRPSGPRNARGFALVGVAMHDAALATWDAKEHYQRIGPDNQKNSYPSEPAAVGYAAAIVLGHLFPQVGEDAFLNETRTIVDDRVNGRFNWPSDIAAGEAIGRAVAAKVLAHAAMDGSDAPIEWEWPAGDCVFEPTPPLFAQVPLEPMWMDVTPWVLPSKDHFRAGPPPVCDSQEFVDDMMVVYDSVNALSDEEVVAIKDASKGIDGLPGAPKWTTKALLYARQAGLSTPQAAQLFAALGITMHDTTIAAWDGKYHYLTVRPITWIRDNVDPDWETLRNTPRFPGYPSQNPAYGALSAEILGVWFPDLKQPFEDNARLISKYRVWAGSHPPSDIGPGWDLGKQVARLVLAEIGRPQTDPPVEWGGLDS